MFALQEQILDTIEQFMHYCWQLGLFEYKHDLDFSLGSLQSHVMRWTPFSDYECILWLWNQPVDIVYLDILGEIKYALLKKLFLYLLCMNIRNCYMACAFL